MPFVCPCGWKAPEAARSGRSASAEDIRALNARIFRHLLARDGKVVWDTKGGKPRCRLVLRQANAQARACRWTANLRSGISPAPCSAVLLHGIGHTDRATADIAPTVPPVSSVVRVSACFLCRQEFSVTSSTKDHVGATARAKFRLPLCGRCKTFTELRNNNKISAFSRAFRSQFCDPQSLSLYVPQRLNACLTCDLDIVHLAYRERARTAARTGFLKDLQQAARFILYSILWQLSNEVNVYLCRKAAHCSNPITVQAHVSLNYIQK